MGTLHAGPRGTEEYTQTEGLRIYYTYHGVGPLVFVAGTEEV